jgi:hypothetical protein
MKYFSIKYGRAITFNGFTDRFGQGNLSASGGPSPVARIFLLAESTCIASLGKVIKQGGGTSWAGYFFHAANYSHMVIDKAIPNLSEITHGRILWAAFSAFFPDP